MPRYELLADSRLSIAANSSVHPIEVQATDVRGGFDAELVDGELVVEPGGHLEVDVRGLSSGNVLVDSETRRRLNPRAHPMLEARLTVAEPAGPGVLACRATVDFHGHARRVQGQLSVRQDGDGDLVLTGEQRVDVRRWGVQPPRLLLLKVDPIVAVTLELRAHVVA
jgi:hypothetical protein